MSQKRWKTLVLIPLSHREENLEIKSAPEHAHDWHTQKFVQKYAFTLLFQDAP